MLGKTNAPVSGNRTVKHGVVGANNQVDTILDTGIKDIVQLSMGNAGTADHLLTMIVDGQLQIVVNRGYKKVTYLGNGKFAFQRNGGYATCDWVAS